MNNLEIREAVLQLPRLRNGKIVRVPEPLRSAILKQASEHEGPRSGFAKSIGLSTSVIDSWLKSKASGVGKLKRLRVVENVALPHGHWRLEGPLGVRVSGMTITELCEFFHKLEAR